MTRVGLYFVVQFARINQTFDENVSSLCALHRTNMYVCDELLRIATVYCVPSIVIRYVAFVDIDRLFNS